MPAAQPQGRAATRVLIHRLPSGRTTSAIVAILLAIAACQRANAGWDAQTSGTAHDLYGVTASHSDINTAWACGAGGTILHTTDGLTWNPQSSGTTQTLRAMAFIEATGNVMCVGDGGTLLVTSDMGANWIPRTTGTTADLRGITEFRHYAVGDSGIVLRSIDAGATWARVPSGTTARLHAVQGVFTAMAVGDSGTILTSTNMGASWSKVASGRQEHLYGIPMFANLNLAVGSGGLILRSTTHGASWFAAPSGTGADLRATQSNGNGSHIYCVGGDGAIRKSLDSGTTWGRQVSGTQADLNASFFYLNDTFGWIVGAGGTILKTMDGGGTVTDAAPPGSIDAVQIGTGGPNPVRGSTAMWFRLGAAADVRVRVVDVRGRERALLLRQRFDAGTHTLRWDAAGIASGVYFVELCAGGRAASHRVVVVR